MATAPNEVWIPSPCYSPGGVSQNKFVFHTTESGDNWDIYECGDFFANPNNGVSSHFGTSQHNPGLVGAYVDENNKAWTQGNANPYCISVEMCAYASWSRSEWLDRHRALVDTSADLAAWICQKYGIPVRSLSASEAQNPSTKGICDHVDFGAWGGGHHDCGEGFPMDYVIERILGGGGGATPSPSGEEPDVSIAMAVDPNGSVHRAWLNTKGQVVYAPPGRDQGYIIDPTQNGAKSGVSLVLVPNEHSFTSEVGYTNGNNAPCHYFKPWMEGEWVWGALGPNNSAR